MFSMLIVAIVSILCLLIVYGMIYNLNDSINECVEGVNRRLDNFIRVKRRSEYNPKITILNAANVKAYKTVFKIQLSKYEFIDHDDVKKLLLRKMENELIENMEFFMQENYLEDVMEFHGVIRIAEVKEDSME